MTPDVSVEDLTGPPPVADLTPERRHARTVTDGPDSAVAGARLADRPEATGPAGEPEDRLGPGRVLGPYQVLQEVGRGGFGRVYRAKHVVMDRIVALKVIAPERVEDQRARAMFLREVRAATRLHHANIALAYDAGEGDGQLFLAMEYVDGPNLEQLVRARGPLPLSLAGPMLRQAAQALRYAHDQGMVHRDIKPANLLIPHTALAASSHLSLDGPPLVKVVDFGLARLQTRGTAGTLFAGREKVFAGTPDFISPEQARNAHNVDARSDLYSLGCTFYFALTGRRPFDGANPLEIVLKHFEQAPEPLDRLRPDLPSEIIAVINRLMEKQPEQRFPSARELLAEMGYSSGGGSVPVIALPPAPLPETSPTVASAPDIALPPTARTDRDAAEQWPGHDDAAVTLQLPAIDAAQSPDSPAAPARPAPPASVQPLAAVAPGPELPASACGAAAATELRQAWSEWYAVIVALRHGVQHGVSPTEYRARHGRLLRALRAAAGADGARHAGYARLESLVEPWLGLPTLTSTDSETLDDLAGRAAGLAAGLGLADGARAVSSWAVLLTVVLLALPLSGMASLQLHAGQMRWHLPSPHAAWQFVQANPVLSLALLLPATVFAGLYGLGRLLRE